MQNLLIIGYVWPEPTATAAGCRMLQIIEQFKNLGCKITFVSTAKEPEKGFDLSSIDVVTNKVVLNNTSFDLFLKDLQPDIVMFDRFMIEEQFGWRVAENCPEAIRILDSEDLHFLRKARQETVKKGGDVFLGKINSDEAKREIASIYRCDVTFTISEYEMEYLQKEYNIPSYLLWYFPFLIDLKKQEAIDFEDTQDFMFIGNFIHAPNWDAVLQLKQVFWPKIKKQLPKARLHIYGGYPSEKVFQLHNKAQGFLVHGRASDVDVVMKGVRVCLAPMRFGAGLKGKLIDAMQNYLPFVTTKIGAEGMFGEMDMSSAIAIDENDFVNKAVQLYQEQDLWEEMVLKGKQVLEKRFSKAEYKAEFYSNWQYLQAHYKSQRDLNFIGAMLQHHSLQSTKYLSKWIESKNAKS